MLLLHRGSLCLRLRTSSIWVSCSQVKEGWSKRRIDESTSWRIDVLSSVLSALLWSVVVEQKLSYKLTVNEVWIMLKSLILRDKMRRSIIQEELREEQLLLWWYGHLIKPPRCLPLEILRACPTKRPQGRPRTCWKGYISCLSWEHIGIP